MLPFQPRFHQRETRQFEKIPLSQRISAKSLRTATSAQAVTSASRRSEGFKRPGTGTNARVDISRHARDMELGARPVLLAQGASSASFARCRGTVRSPGDLSTCQSTPSLRNETLSQRATS